MRKQYILFSRCLILYFLRSPIKRGRSRNFAFPILPSDLFYTVLLHPTISIREKRFRHRCNFSFGFLAEPIGYYALYLFISYKIFISIRSSVLVRYVDLTPFAFDVPRSDEKKGEREKSELAASAETSNGNDTVYSGGKI